MSTFHAYVDAAHFHEALGNVLRFAAKRSRQAFPPSYFGGSTGPL